MSNENGLNWHEAYIESQARLYATTTALEDLLAIVECDPEADNVGSDLYIAIKCAQIAIDPSLGWAAESRGGADG